MTVTFYGVRGSIAVPGAHTERYGGNTSCLSVAVDDSVLVIDAGTGIRRLGHALDGGSDTIYVLFTHLHDDHVQGFPYFAPLYEPRRVLHLIAYDPPDGSAPWSPLALFDGTHFPLRPGDLPADCRTVEAPLADALDALDLHVERMAVQHPGGAYAYRIAHDDATFVHVSDNELAAPDAPPEAADALADFCRGADVLCHDAQYDADDMPAKRGWGHSTVAQACDLARAAEVGHLVLFHHDPERSDAAVRRMEGRGQSLLETDGIPCTAAYEGLTLSGTPLSLASRFSTHRSGSPDHAAD